VPATVEPFPDTAVLERSLRMVKPIPDGYHSITPYSSTVTGREA
jgi:hypothetical protein